MKLFYLRILCLILFLIGCGEKAKEQLNDTDPAKYTVSIDRLVTIPEDFPSDVYIYPRSNPIGFKKKENIERAVRGDRVGTLVTRNAAERK